MLATALLWLLWLRTLFRFYGRVARSNFPAADVAISILGVPMFCWLLVRSHLHHRVSKSVDWKGRRYKVGR
jgi:di/tricarboxylate transporter